jgi:hypothetical protein
VYTIPLMGVNNDLSITTRKKISGQQEQEIRLKERCF